MERLKVNALTNKHGFTLIEVLIALAVLAIALTAIIRTTSHSISDTAYLQSKITANWVGKQIINEVRLGVIQISSDDLEEETEMLGQTWLWRAKLTTTPNPRIKKINVDVLKKSNKASLAHLESYVYVK